MGATQEKLRKIVLEHTVKVSVMGALNLSDEKYDEIKLETDLSSELGIDSLDAAEIIMRVEEDHDLEEIPEDYARKANTVKHIYDYLLEHCTKPLDKLVDFTKKDVLFNKFLASVAVSFNCELANLEAVSSMSDLVSVLISASAK
ncbi:acyl carrier protein [Neorickettsia sennetsu]|uniref:Acyl carrier protein AcpXL n=1 Tax=Ehrlichia sennetsu (strain ATCC VR-367 / Miyayama) TaxID=222891 RepID=Q2GDV9_EHRS3|nr:phosphopantetheine-binding protein [Neorickettsia sennetsu]ABD46342.1 acyl carrier protein [Neorickettsia sennetsu str. Miyayama]